MFPATQLKVFLHPNMTRKYLRGTEIPGFFQILYNESVLLILNEQKDIVLREAGSFLECWN